MLWALCALGCIWKIVLPRKVRASVMQCLLDGCIWKIFCLDDTCKLQPIKDCGSGVSHSHRESDRGPHRKRIRPEGETLLFVSIKETKTVVNGGT
jgi:hypothetical protein